VVLTTSAGFLAAGGPVAWGPLAAVSVGTMLAAGSANTFNQVRCAFF
jgi:heme O synthase-like polyprenyltransferase